MNRRAFLVSTVGAGAHLRTPATPALQHLRTPALQHTGTPALQSPPPVRARWLAHLQRIADPVLTNLASGTLKARMPVEEAAGANRHGVTHLEALGRLAAGIAPWLDLDDGPDVERILRTRYRDLLARGLAHALDPASPDAMNFTQGSQPLVDAAFLAQAVLRAPGVLQRGLAPQTRTRLVAAFESARVIQPGFNNWLLFAATVEAALKALGQPWDRMRVDYALRQHEQWYRGDGAYSDGPAFHWDYYNSFVIHPMLIDVLAVVGGRIRPGQPLPPSRRYARHATPPSLSAWWRRTGPSLQWDGRLGTGVAPSRRWLRPHYDTRCHRRSHRPKRAKR